MANYPALKMPDIDPAIISLETGASGLVDTVRKFLEGYYDPSAEQFKNYVNVIRSGAKTATKDFQKNILATQGAQRVYGGSAGKQLNKALIDKMRNDLELEQEFLWDSLNQVIDNRKFGVQAGSSIVNSNRNYAFDLAQMENDYNSRKWQAYTADRAYRRSTALNFRNIMTPTNIKAGLELLTKAVFHKNAGS